VPLRNDRPHDAYGELMGYQRWPGADFRTRGPYEENVMKSGNKLFIFTGIALALVTVLLAITMTGENKVDAQKDDDPGKVKVMQAAADFEPHKVIAMSDIVIVEMATDKVPSDAATDTALVLGQSYKIGAVKGDILLSTYLEAPGITNSIEAGKRAISVQVDTQGMMSGLIMDGDYVDVIFDARVDLRRVLEMQGLEVEEDGPYTIKFGSDKNESDDSGDTGDTGDTENQDQDDSGPDVAGIEAAPYQGKDGSEFTAVDAGQNLEPVTKMLVQDVKVLRVIQPGVTYDGQGQQVQGTADEPASAPGNNMGQLIIEVTPQQAEAITFMQDQNHNIEVAVRGKDDHEIAKTSGITFQILMSDGTWSMPWPQPILAPEVKASDD
jgi:Flp pilus assembly protein CpaB